MGWSPPLRSGLGASLASGQLAASVETSRRVPDAHWKPQRWQGDFGEELLSRWDGRSGVLRYQDSRSAALTPEGVRRWLPVPSGQLGSVQPASVNTSCVGRVMQLTAGIISADGGVSCRG